MIKSNNVETWIIDAHNRIVEIKLHRSKLDDEANELRMNLQAVDKAIRALGHAGTNAIISDDKVK